jgi:hypothetical protein
MSVRLQNFLSSVRTFTYKLVVAKMLWSEAIKRDFEREKLYQKFLPVDHTEESRAENIRDFYEPQSKGKYELCLLVNACRGFWSIKDLFQE